MNDSINKTRKVLCERAELKRETVRRRKMKKFLIYIKWASIAVLTFIVVLWLSYFFDSLHKLQHHFVMENNYALNFLKWFNKMSNGAFVFRFRFFDDNLYLEDFPGVSVFAEVLFIILLLIIAIRQKQNRNQYILKLSISVICFIVLFKFLDATLMLFVPG
jgi:hypothetical protein